VGGGSGWLWSRRVTCVGEDKAYASCDGEVGLVGVVMSGGCQFLRSCLLRRQCLGTPKVAR